MIKKNYIVVLSVLLSISALYIISSFKDQGIKFQPSFQSSSMENLHLVHREENKIIWELSARGAIFPIGAKEILLNSMGIRIHQDPEIYLSSGSGVYEIENAEVVLDKNVELNISNTTFMTNTLKWDSANELITTDDNVRYSGKNFLIEGSGLAASIKQQKVRILKNVKATFYLT